MLAIGENNENEILQSPGLIVSNRITITCTSCSQPLAVDASSAGKKVRCPKCQSVTLIATPKVVAPSKSPTVAKRVVGCPKCKTRMSVPILEKSFVAKCPGCQTTVQIEASTTLNPPAEAASPQRPSTMRSVLEPAVTPIASGGPDFDLGSLDLPPIANPNQRSFSMQSPATSSAYSSLSASVTRPNSKYGSWFLTWINDHRWVSAIVLLNLLALLSCIIFPPLLIIVLIGLPVAAVIVGLLFVPRQHTIRRVVDVMGSQLVGIGGGGILLVLAISAKGIMRATRRAQGNPNLDFSNISEILLVLGGIALVGIVFIVLWRYIGVAQVMAAGYCTALTIGVLMGVIGATPRGGPVWASRVSNGFPEWVNPPQFPGDDFTKQKRAEHDAFMATIPAEHKRHQAEFEARAKAGSSDSALSPPPPPAAQPDSKGRSASVTQIGVKRYPVSLPLPAGSRLVDADMKLVPGLKLKACYAGSWCKVTIVQVNDDGTLRMNWDDYKAFTYDMAREDMIIDIGILESLGN